ncbi:murein biosynthesis integral membrane protein MurJ [Pleionea sp. CnH1-48]|nr:murein biosynthesis integral membrane protein MurJ [Pleionea sp. CnH1-48]
MTFLSRILGLVRDVVMLDIFGASGTTDVFLVAQKIPNFLRRLFAEGAFAQAFVPILSEYQLKKDHYVLRQFISRVAGTLGGILFLMTLLGVLGASGLIAVFSPGFVSQPEKHQLASDLLQITFPYIFFISLTAFAGSILNSLGKFAIPAFTPVLLNVSMISCALWLAPQMDTPVFALAWGVFIAGIIQFALQLPFLWKEGLLVKPQWGWKDSGVRKVLKLMAPALFGVSVSQLNLLLDTIIASLLITGSISWLYTADRMLEFPLGVFGIAIATVVLPSLSRQHLSDSKELYNKTLNWGIHIVLLIGLPAACGLFVLSEPVLLTIFQHGEFLHEDALMASYAMQAYICGLVSFMLIKVLASGYFSRQDTKTPMKIGVIAMVVNMVFNIILFKPYGHVGLATATAISAFVNMSLLLAGLIRSGALSFSKQWWWWLTRMLVANLVMVAALLWWMPTLEEWRAWTATERILPLAVTILLGAAAYAAVLVLLGIRPRHLKAH